MRLSRLVFPALAAAAMPLTAAPALAQADLASGQKLFAQRCATCHGVSAAENKSQGPNLAGVVGRKAASVAEFKYTPAFAALTQTWDEKSLDAFLAAPATLAPGTAMVLVVPQADDREDLIAYLKTLK
jgi:cytochrome c2